MENNLPGKILVIDDDQALRELLEEDLGRRGHSIWTAPDVLAARELLQQQEIDIVVEWSGGVVKWRSGEVKERWGRGMVEWRSDGLVKWKCGGVVEWQCPGVKE